MVISSTDNRDAQVLIAHTGEHSVFPERDAAILAEHYPVTRVGVTALGHRFALRRALRQANLAIFWFVGRAAFLGLIPPPRNTKTICVIGGYEAVNRPDLSYGSVRSSWRRKLIGHILKQCDRVVCVSEFSRESTRELFSVDERKIELIHNAIDTDFFTPTPERPRKPGTVLTVSSLDRERIKIKGLDILTETARLLPDVSFNVVGKIVDSAAQAAIQTAPNNMTFTGVLDHEALRELYRTHAVYYQPSRHESFGVSVIEAMACGCIPVCSRFGALPEVVGDVGMYLDGYSAESGAEVIRQALVLPDDYRHMVRRRVVDNFGVAHRRERLLHVVREVLGR